MEDGHAWGMSLSSSDLFVEAVPILSYCVYRFIRTFEGAFRQMPPAACASGGRARAFMRFEVANSVVLGGFGGRMGGPDPKCERIGAGVRMNRYGQPKKGQRAARPGRKGRRQVASPGAFLRQCERIGTARRRLTPPPRALFPIFSWHRAFRHTTAYRHLVVA